MKRKTYCLCIAFLMLLSMPIALVQAESTIEEGRSSVPTAPLISWEEQRAGAGQWSGYATQSSAYSSSSTPYAQYAGNGQSYTTGQSQAMAATQAQSQVGSPSGYTVYPYSQGTWQTTYAQPSQQATQQSCPPSNTTYPANSANCGAANTAYQSTVENGRSSVPTAPLITWEAQRGLVSQWPYTGSLTPDSSMIIRDGNQKATNPSSCRGDSGNGNPSPDTLPDEPDTSTDGTDGHYTPSGLTAQELYLYNAVNEERTSRGLSALPIDLELSAIARAKSTDMVENNYFAHESPTYGNSSEMLDQAGYNYTSVSENIARSASVEKGHASLMSSDGHRRAILGSQWTRVGIGIVNDKNGYPYITQLFVR